MKDKLAIVILAAGKGTRMDSELPKVLHKVNGKPMIVNVLNSAIKLKPNLIITIVGYKADLVKESLTDYNTKFVLQKEQKGTGHAVLQCSHELKNFDEVFLTGTAAEITPVKSIDSLGFRTGDNTTTFQFMKDYKKIVTDTN